jgi:Arc/MetJ family transcription regulator
VVVGGRGRQPALSYLGYDRSMAVGKVSLSIDEDVLAEARTRAGRRELSSYVNEALRRQLQRDRLAELLAEMDAESGPIPDDVMEEARRPWREPGAKRRRSA